MLLLGPVTTHLHLFSQPVHARPAQTTHLNTQLQVVVAEAGGSPGAARRCQEPPPLLQRHPLPCILLVLLLLLQCLEVGLCYQLQGLAWKGQSFNLMMNGGR